MDASVAAQSSQTLPNWLVYIKELGVPTLFGVVLGGILGFITTVYQSRINMKHREKKLKELRTEIFLTKIIQYQSWVRNTVEEWKIFKEKTDLKKLSSDITERRITLASEPQAIAKLYFPQHISKSLQVMGKSFEKILEPDFLEIAKKPKMSEKEIKKINDDFEKKFEKLVTDLKHWVNQK